MRISNPVLLDTNVLVYAHNQASPLHSKALTLVKTVVEGSIRGVLAHQNLLEFYSIVTDKKRIPKPLSCKQAYELIEEYLNSSFKIIYPNSQTILEGLSLGQNLQFKNGKIFDAYLVATLFSNNIKSIITANVKDFNHFSGLEVISLE